MRLLLVDDDETFRTGLAANLQDDGHEVVECGDPRELMAQGAPDDVHVALIDYEMPHVNGLTLVERLHGTRPEIAFVLVTAYWTTELEKQVASYGFLRLCRKPVEYDVLHEMVHSAARGPTRGAE